MENTLSIKVALQIQKPVSEVFEAIVDPKHMTQYFISESSGRMVEGKTVFWSFPEFEGTDPIQVKKIETDKLIIFSWKIETFDHLVEIILESRKDNDTLVTVQEKERPNNPSGIKWLMGNTEGWTNFLCCLKAYLEHGINLRKGGYDYLKK
ncbi:SRPBCC domain-containing protein [Aquiflexum gelatinilyticum]|uniref:SRPBCC domain-containing protein n=1 Tax=Aquiflexum gelatinilyticum TaxID=2961943 RepID=UPI002168236F|nr:SRPBCC domain-containing protein [Aquiflexum gelatinilyticum]MCS4434586.1 SRPBCC domain-containing protein [Aquiflexum gelatinilyticum]